MTSKIITANKQAAISAAVLETGRIANNKAIQLVSSKLPMLARGYANTSMGKLAVANAALMAANQFKPDNVMLQRITNGMVVSAYQELIQEFDIEGMLDTLIADSKVSAAVKKLSKAED